MRREKGSARGYFSYPYFITDFKKAIIGAGFHPAPIIIPIYPQSSFFNSRNGIINVRIENSWQL